MTTNNLTEQWKKGELPTGIYYIIDYEDLEVIDEYVNGFGFVKFEPKEVLAPVPSYGEWQTQKECLWGVMEANKILSRKYNNIKVNGNYPDRISKLKSRIKGLTEELEPFTDPYFRGLTTKDIAELAKKSIRLTKQHCEDTTALFNIKELLCYCADELEAIEDKDIELERLLEEIEKALK